MVCYYLNVQFQGQRVKVSIIFNKSFWELVLLVSKIYLILCKLTLIILLVGTERPSMGVAVGWGKFDALGPSAYLREQLVEAFLNKHRCYIDN
jgi:hypothetical protein